MRPKVNNAIPRRKKSKATQIQQFPIWVISIGFCKSLVGFVFDALTLVGSEEFSYDLGDPQQHFFEAE